MNDRLLYGKAQSHKAYNIVSIEIKDDIATLFHQNEDGSVYKTLEANRFWIVSNKQEKPDWKRLKGDSYYKWGRQFETREHFEKARRYLKSNSDIYSIYDPKESFQVLKGYTYYRGLKPKDISILSFDLETTGLLFNKDSRILLISNTFRTNEKNYNSETEEWEDNFVIIKKLFSYDDYENEGEMLKAWCKWVCEMDPSIICGHNINSFDLNYLQFIARRFDIELNLGRDGSALKTNTYESKKRKDGSQDLHYFKSHIYGREIIDTLFLSINYDVVAKKYITLGLKAIIAAEGLEKANRTFYDASQIRFNYKDPIEWVKIKEYAKDDSDDALTLFDLMAPAQFYWTQMVPKPFQLITESATGSQVNSILVRSYLQEGHSIPKADYIEGKFDGAISYGNPGIFSNCIKWDVASLYPSIMLQYEIYNKEKDPEANFLKLLQILTNERLKNKKLAKDTKNSYYKDMEQSQKIGINSMYGFMGTNGLQFNYLIGASKTTEYGREILKNAIKWATGKDYNVQNE